MNRTHGFKIILDDYEHYITFAYDGDKVRCTLHAKTYVRKEYNIDPRFLHQESWTSQVTCKSADKYDRVKGEKLALKNVVRKYCANRNRAVAAYKEEVNSRMDAIADGIYYKFDKASRSV
jgi:hypothetical protein